MSILRAPLTLGAALPLAAAGAIVAAGLMWSGVPAGAAEPTFDIPAPAVDETAGGGLQTAVFAGGCFWGVQGVYQHVVGVQSAVSGYAGGSVTDPSYHQVSAGTTGHAEAVKITYDPSQVSYGKLLQIFFSVVADPTQLNRQGPDHGTQYRSAIFTMNGEQKRVADAYIAQLDKTGIYGKPIVTEVTPYTNFYQAEDYHQDATTTISINPGYITYYDLPKIEALKAKFPEVWRAKAKLVFASNAGA